MFFSLHVNASWIYDEILGAWYNTDTGEIRITGDDDMDGDVGSIFLYDGAGQKIGSRMVTVVYNPITKEYTISTAGLQQGTYILVIVSVDGHTKTIRFVI